MNMVVCDFTFEGKSGVIVDTSKLKYDRIYTRQILFDVGFDVENDL